MTDTLPVSAEKLARFAPGCDASAIAPGLAAAALRYEITPGLRLWHWMAQLHHESAGFTRLVESLSYSAQRLTEVWPGRFPTLASAQPYARNPQALAVKVYNNRMGNATPEDCIRYIGRGFIQCTGRELYAKMGALVGLDLLKDPGLAGTPEVAAKIAGAYWHDRGINALADADDIVAVTRAVNGGAVGLVDRRLQFARARLAFP